VNHARKRIVSIRLAASDLEKVKALAGRLRVRESEVLRYAVKSMLARLSALHDRGLAGSDLVPVFIAHGREILSHFELDAEDLDAVINSGVVAPAAEVPWEDLELLALLSAPEDHVVTKFRRITGLVPGPGGLCANVEAHLRARYTLSDAAPAEPGRSATAAG
jgi:hypothetical protein